MTLDLEIESTESVKFLLYYWYSSFVIMVEHHFLLHSKNSRYIPEVKVLRTNVEFEYMCIMRFQKSLPKISLGGGTDILMKWWLNSFLGNDYEKRVGGCAIFPIVFKTCAPKVIVFNTHCSTTPHKHRTLYFSQVKLSG